MHWAKLRILDGDHSEPIALILITICGQGNCKNAAFQRTGKVGADGPGIYPQCPPGNHIVAENKFRP
jgi:hypothetical protein